MASITLEMKGDEKDLAAKLFRIEQLFGSLNKKLDETGRTSDTAGRLGVSSFQRFGEVLGGSVLQRLSAATLAATGLAAAVKLAAGEFANFDARARAAGGAALTVDQAHGDLARALVGVPDAQVRGAFGSVRRLSGATGVSEQFIAPAVGAAFSGGASLPLSLDIADVSARFLRDRPAEVVDFARSLQLLTSAAGGESPLAALGLMQRVGGLTPLKNASVQAQVVPQAMTNLIGTGSTLSEAVALFSSIVQTGKDVDGNESVTATQRFSQKLRQELPILPTGMMIGPWGDVNYFQPTTGERIGFLQQNPSIAKQLLNDVNLQSKRLPQLEALLLNPDSDTAKMYAEVLQMPLSLAGLRAEGEASLRRLALSPNALTTELSNSLKTMTEGLLTADPKIAQVGILREWLPQVLQASGVSKVGQYVQDLDLMRSGDFRGRDPLEYARDALQRRRYELADQATEYTHTTVFGDRVYRRVGRDNLQDAQPEQRSMIEMLDAGIRRLEDAIREGNETQKAAAAAAQTTASNTMPRGGPLADHTALSRESLMDVSRFSPFAGGY